MTIRSVLQKLLLLLALLPLQNYASLEEYRLKAILLNKLIDFIDWPTESSSQSLCIIGENTFEGQLAAAFIQRKKVAIKQLDEYQPEAGCSIVFISNSEQKTFRETLRVLSSKPVLTVSDIPNFALNGGMINMRLVNRRVRFQINQEVAEESGLKISYKLLRLADIVSTIDEGDS